MAHLPGEKGHAYVAAAGGEVLLLEHGEYRGSVPADGGPPVTCLLALTKVRGQFTSHPSAVGYSLWACVLPTAARLSPACRR